MIMYRKLTSFMYGMTLVWTHVLAAFWSCAMVCTSCPYPANSKGGTAPIPPAPKAGLPLSRQLQRRDCPRRHVPPGEMAVCTENVFLTPTQPISLGGMAVPRACPAVATSGIHYPAIATGGSRFPLVSMTAPT